MGRSIVYRPNKRVRIVSGLFAGETGTIDKISRDGKDIKLVGRGWYPRRMLRVIRKRRKS